ncbi:hypothetical protein GCM10010104_59910 [Streptomyces indiaensis]|uniref:Uncharacterized protein n=1 Tax=Streptomyces indiaensis TaxID=284033 RepID=A0ABN3ED15_9ACTN
MTSGTSQTRPTRSVLQQWLAGAPGQPSDAAPGSPRAHEPGPPRGAQRLGDDGGCTNNAGIGNRLGDTKVSNPDLLLTGTDGVYAGVEVTAPGAAEHQRTRRAPRAGGRAQ